MKETFLNGFEKPGSEYRGAPFWAWNGKLEPEELRRQIRLMHQMGLGGFFMHSRVGLDTEYLSDEWFECINACIDEAEKLDMQAWLYDEDRWPSGAAGGKVTKNPKYRHRSLIVQECKSVSDLVETDMPMGLFLVNKAGNQISNVKRITEKEIPQTLGKSQVVLQFYVRLDSLGSWFNGYTYLDTLSHEAVQEFIKVTHEEYEKRIGDKLGKRVPGIFTDEPNYGHLASGNNEDNCGYTPWTEKLPEIFNKRYGYDIIDRLPELFYDLEGQEVSQARYHFCDCLTFLFVDAFARQIGEWCDKTNMMHTGHVLEEDTLCRQAHAVGSGMRFYEFMQAPGMDLLTEHWRVYDTAKQVSSAARQFDRKWRLTETYGCTGWDFPFAGHKALGDWQAALGINLRCQHLYWYTMQAEAKRDYPASIAHQSPWWDSYAKVEDYFARINYVMTQGKEVRDLLVVHPVESSWLLSKKGWRQNKETWAFDWKFTKLRDNLLCANIDFDYGEEEIMSRHASVKKVKGEAILTIAKADYKCVVVPEMITMRRSTLKLLKEFKAAGGTVVFAGAVATHVEAIESDAVATFAKSCIKTNVQGSKLIDAVETSARRLSILDKSKKEITATLHLLREDKDNYYLFICNTGNSEKAMRAGKFRDDEMARDRSESFKDVTIKLAVDSAARVVEMDADQGDIYEVDATVKSGTVTIKTDLPALASKLYIIEKTPSKNNYAKQKSMTVKKKKALKYGKWDIIKSEENVLVLDTPAYKIADKKEQKPLEILKVDYAVRDELGIQHRGGNMTQPWARERKKNPVSVELQLRYCFKVDVIPSGALFLGLEKPELYTVSLNGFDISTDMSCGWWCDKSLSRLPINPASLTKGVNELVLTTSYNENHPGLEIIYLLGDFGAKVKDTDVSITASPQSLKIGNWGPQGLPFYSGSICYCKSISLDLAKGEKAFIHVPDYRASAVRVIVNGKTAGVIAWEPNELNITDFLQKGKNDLRIEVIGHRRNSHGPFHYAEKWPDWTGPGQFVSSGDRWVDSYQLVPCGLMKDPEILIKK